VSDNKDTRTNQERTSHADVANVLEHVSTMTRNGAVKALRIDWTGNELQVKMDLRSQTDLQLCLDFNLNKEPASE